MHLFDLHCDTVTACLDGGRSLVSNDLQLDLMRGNELGSWVQVFAFWLDTAYCGEAAYARFLSQRELLMKTLAAHPDQVELYHAGKLVEAGKCAAILAVEGGHVLGGRLSRIAELKQLGVSFLTLVWNGDNEIGSGVKGNGGGLTPFGRAAIAELEQNNIVIDISHLNQRGTDELFALAQKPILATHSNARAVHDHPRNLYDYQLHYLITHQGLCGLNFYPPFVTGGENYTPEELHRHIDHILALGGEDILALGSDFDGADMPDFLKGIETLYSLYDYVVKWYHKKIADKLFYDNAKRFMDRNLVI